MNWIEAADAATLAEQGRALFRHDRLKIALFWVNGKPYAVDNRCPHEGYPLREGTVKDESCELTCQWHNWKFDLRTGRCLYGEDHVRAYPAKIEGGSVWLDLREPPAEERLATILDGMDEAVAQRQYGRIAREAARLIAAGFDPLEAVRRSLRRTHDRLEFGMTHAHAGLADWLALFEAHRHDRETQVVCLAEALDHLADDTLRQPVFSYAGGSLPFDGEAFTAAVAAEDEPTAIALVNGALADALPWDDLAFWFAKAALRHYAAFGHSLIYTDKVGLLLERLGGETASWLLPPLVRSLVQATREDLLPEFRAYAEYADRDTPPGEARALADGGQVFGLSVAKALAWTDRQLAERAPEAVYWALLEANARNLAHFDEGFQFAYDRPVSQNVGWLSFTHGVTFGHAVRRVCTAHPSLWRPALLQMACFVGRNKAFIDRELDTSQWSVDDSDAFFAQALERVFDHGVNVPIFSVHYLKTLLATQAESRDAPERVAAWLWTGVHRFFTARLKQKHARRTARQALALIEP